MEQEDEYISFWSVTIARLENNAGEYSNPDEKERNKLLVERVESIVSAETSKYFTIHQPQKKLQQQENEKASQTQ